MAKHELNEIYAPGAGKPDRVYIANLAERPPGCPCSWTIHEYKPPGQSTFYVKYFHTGCRSRRDEHQAGT